MKQLTLIAICLFFSTHIFALEVPPLNGTRVNDYAGILSSNQEKILDQKLAKDEQGSSNQIAILIVESLKGEEIESFANNVFRTWKLGQAGKNNGVLIVLGIKEHRMRIEVGYGLEGVLPDGRCSEIINNVMKPAFKQNQFYEGLDLATDKINQAIKGEYKAEAIPATNSNKMGGLITVYLIITVVLLIITAALSNWHSIISGLFGGGSIYLITQLFFHLIGLSILGGILGFTLGIICGIRNENGNALGGEILSGIGDTLSSSSSSYSSSSGSSYSGGGGSSDSGSSFSGGGGDSGGGGASGGW